MFPLPAGGAVEGETGYTCTGGGDCHLLVLDRPAGKLYEAYQASVTSGSLSTLCAVVWDLTRVYPPSGRGDQCTSTDAAGFPVAALLFTADEVASGHIDHAIRFILPNARMRAGVYVHPATHGGAPSGPAQAPPYGSRFRLRANYPVASLPSAGSRVVAQAMQRYGMLLADGGNIALTAADDRFTSAKWAGVLDAGDLSALQVSDFEMVDGGTRIPLTDNCVRNP
jgi:serine/threonine-protein kinase